MVLQNRFFTKDFHLLGKGESFVVFTDFKVIYKVFHPKNPSDKNTKNRLMQSLLAVRSKFENSSFFYPILDICDISENHFILIFPYENSQPCEYFTNMTFRTKK